MENITAESLGTTITVILAIFAIIITVDKIMDIWRKWRKPATDVDAKLNQDKIRLDGHDRDIHSLREGNRVLMEGQIALLDHELHNGNAEQMQKARNAISKYLLDTSVAQ